MTRLQIVNALLGNHPHDYALRDPNRLLERVDIIVEIENQARALEKEARELGFCQYSRDLRVKAMGLREFGSLLLSGQHLDWLDDRRIGR